MKPNEPERFNWTKEGMEPTSVGDYVEYDTYETLDNAYADLVDELEDLERRMSDLLRKVR